MWTNSPQAPQPQPDPLVYPQLQNTYGTNSMREIQWDTNSNSEHRKLHNIKRCTWYMCSNRCRSWKGPSRDRNETFSICRPHHRNNRSNTFREHRPTRIFNWRVWRWEWHPHNDYSHNPIALTVGHFATKWVLKGCYWWSFIVPSSSFVFVVKKKRPSRISYTFFKIYFPLIFGHSFW